MQKRDREPCIALRLQETSLGLHETRSMRPQACTMCLGHVPACSPRTVHEIVSMHRVHLGHMPTCAWAALSTHRPASYGLAFVQAEPAHLQAWIYLRLGSRCNATTSTSTRCPASTIFWDLWNILPPSLGQTLATYEWANIEVKPSRSIRSILCCVHLDLRHTQDSFLQQ